MCRLLQEVFYVRHRAHTQPRFQRSAVAICAGLTRLARLTGAHISSIGAAVLLLLLLLGPCCLRFLRKPRRHQAVVACCCCQPAKRALQAEAAGFALLALLLPCSLGGLLGLLVVLAGWIRCACDEAQQLLLLQQHLRPCAACRQPRRSCSRLLLQEVCC
jgi:hypothetical protein